MLAPRLPRRLLPFGEGAGFMLRPWGTGSWMGKPVLSPLVVPTIVTPAGVVAILFFLAKAGEHELSYQDVLLMLLLMMLLNLVGMLLAAPIIMTPSSPSSRSAGR